MSASFYAKTNEFKTQIKDFEKKKDYGNAIIVINKAISFMEELTGHHGDALFQLYYQNYQSMLEVWKRNLETNAKLNELESHIKKIDEQLGK